MIYILGAVVSHTPGYSSLASMIGPLAFHFISMFLGGIFFQLGLRKAPARAQQQPAAAVEPH